MKKNVLFGIFSLIIFIAAAIYISYPLIFHMTTFVNGEFVIAWIMNWNIHALTHFVWPFFDTNIFYPYHNTLAYSDLFLSSSLLVLPFFAAFQEPMITSNVLFLSALVLMGFFTYILVFYITRNFFASILSGLLIVFSPVFLDKRYHLQILAIEWIPLSLTFFLHFLKRKQYRFLFLSLCFFVVQVYDNFIPGYFLLFLYTGIGSAFFFLDRKVVKPLLTVKTLLLFLLAFLLVIPIAVPYFQVSHEFGFVRDIRETIHLGLQPEDLLVTNDYSRLVSFLWFFSAKQYPVTAEVKPGFLGGVFSVLAIVCCGYAIFLFKNFAVWKRKQNKNKIVFMAFFAVAIVGLVLSFGPALHLGRHTVHHPFLIPLPYALAYYLLPGFKGIRDSSGFEMLFVVAIAVSIGIALHEIVGKKSRFIKIIVYVLLFAGIIGEFHGPIQYEKTYTFQQFPPEYMWIAKNTPQNAVIAEMPIYNWDNNPFGDNREVLREYFSTLHFRKLISGGSGFSPPPWQSFAIQTFADFPSQKSITRIQKYGAQYLIVHASEFDTLYKEGYVYRGHTVQPSAVVLSALSQNTHLRFIIQKGDAYIYEFR